MGIGIVGLVLMLGSPLVWIASRPAESAGDAGAVEAAIRSATSLSVTSSLAPAEPGAPATTTTTVTPSLRFTVSESTLVPVAPAPIGLTIRGIDVDAPVKPFGVDRRSGEMDVPTNVRDVAWYRFGPSPGQAGSAVLAAHVDLSSQGAGVFFNLRDLEPGEIVEVAYEDGSRQPFRVEARVRYDKAEIPLDVIFATDGPPVLTLITCGGGFNPSIESYDSNVVVYAYPVEGDIG
ncbi:MAG: class F sortase [Acidimicrobiia bacterium]|nr:class F sortase [Acidimicrobiia bacterium]